MYGSHAEEMEQYLDYAWTFLLMKWPYAFEVTLFCFTLGMCIRTRTPEPKYWLTDLTTTALAAFGGGTIAPILLGKFPGLVSNDLVVLMLIVLWYITHNLGGWGYKILSPFPLRLVYNALGDMFRAHSICNFVELACKTVPAGKHYPIPFFGPILVGTVSGCFGLFLPFDKGLSALTLGTPFALQSAFLMSVFYHLMAHDTFLIGGLFRGVFGDLTHEQARAACALFGMTMGILHNFFGPDCNPLTPFYDFLYFIFQVQRPANSKKSSPGGVGWDLKNRIKLERLLEALRVLIVIFAIGFHFYMQTPASYLPAGGSLRPGNKIGVCQFLPRYRSCSPYVMVMDSNGSLAVYAGTSSSSSSPPIWKDGPTTSSNKDDIRAELGSDGSLRVVSGKDTKLAVLWNTAVTSNTKSKPQKSPKGKGEMFLTLDASTGLPKIVADGTIVWSG